jgi:hypothetical protein
MPTLRARSAAFAARHHDVRTDPTVEREHSLSPRERVGVRESFGGAR